MKRVVLFLAVLAFGSGLAVGGPERIESDKKAVVMPQPQPESCGWNGFYIGAQIGGAFDSADLHLDLDGDWDTNLPSTRDVGEDFGSRDLQADGLFTGGFAGYNRQWGNLVVGIEGAFSYLGLRNSSAFGFEFVPGDGGNVIAVRQSFETHYLATFGPRFGYAWNRLLFYITGGVAFGDVRFSQKLLELDSGIEQSDSTHDAEVGWTAGAGAEYCLNQHWRVRAEYRYVDLGSADFSTSGTSITRGRDLSGFTGHHSADVSFHSVTAGISYQF